MKVQYVSDMHIQEKRYRLDLRPEVTDEEIFQHFFDIDMDTDVLITAGDMEFSQNFPNLKVGRHLHVNGNHEYWGRYIGRAYEDVPYAVKIDDVTFICATLWSNPEKVYNFSDYSRIDGMNINTYSDLNTQHVSRIAAMLEEHEGGKIVVVTHHAPSYQSARRPNSPVAAMFYNNLDGLILKRKPNVWVHGHTHDPVDYILGDTRVVSNPVGYNGEGVEYSRNASFII